MKRASHRQTIALAAMLIYWTLSDVAAETSGWTKIECVPVNLPAEARFEVTKPILGADGAEDIWTVERGGQSARAELSRDATERRGKNVSWRVDYSFEGRQGIEVVQIETRSRIELRHGRVGIGFWVKLDGAPLEVRARLVDAGGETHQVDLKTEARAGWQYVAFQCDQPGISWGGDGNGKRDFPCRLRGILFDRPQRGYTGSGSLWFSEPSLLAPLRQTDTLGMQIRRPPYGMLYSVGEVFALRVGGRAEKLKWRIENFSGERLAGGEQKGDSAEISWRITQPGFFRCVLELVLTGRTVETKTCAFAAIDGGRVVARSQFVGVCSHFGHKSYPLETMDLMARYGIHQFRDEISWSSVETQKGRRALPEFAAVFLRRAKALNMKPLIILDYGNKHYDGGGFPNSPEAIAGFGAYAVDLLRQVRGYVDMVEVWNEWGGGCGMKGKPGVHDGAAYGRLLLSTHRLIKTTFPDIKVVGIGGEDGSERRPRILDAVRTAGPTSMDAWSIHPYRYPRSPEDSGLVAEVSEDVRLLKELGVKAKVWITETGYPTHNAARGSTEADQARMIVRTLALLQAMGPVEKVFWYDFKDDGLSREYNEHNFGLVYHQRYLCAPKPGVVALSTYIRVTGGALAAESLTNLPENVHAVRFRHAAGPEVLVVWSARGEVPLSCGGTVAQMLGLMGETLPTGRRFEATPTPVYLLGRDLELSVGVTP